MTAHVSMLLKSRVSLLCFRTCFLPGMAMDLSAPRCNYEYRRSVKQGENPTFFCDTIPKFIWKEREIRKTTKIGWKINGILL